MTEQRKYKNREQGRDRKVMEEQVLAQMYIPQQMVIR